MLKVPELAGFWLLSILLQFPLILFQLFNEAILIQPLERGVHIVLALLLLIQVGVQVEFFSNCICCDCQWLKWFYLTFKNWPNIYFVNDPGCLWLCGTTGHGEVHPEPVSSPSVWLSAGGLNTWNHQDLLLSMLRTPVTFCISCTVDTFSKTKIIEIIYLFFLYIHFVKFL